MNLTNDLIVDSYKILERHFHNQFQATINEKEIKWYNVKYSHSIDVFNAMCELIENENKLKDFNDEDKIRAFFGSGEIWQKIGGWDTFEHIIDPPHIVLNHGYNETKPTEEWCLDDMQQAAAYRGGKCLSEKMTTGALFTKLNWQCAEGHTFQASPSLVLKAGHWCDKCLEAPWNFDAQAKKNPFMAQVWHQDHDISENNIYE